MSALISDAGGLAAVLARAAAFAGIAGAIGACAFRLAVSRGGGIGGARSGAASAIAGYGSAAALVAGIAIVGRILAQAEALGSPDQSLAQMIVAVLQTGWGRVASIQFCGAAVAFVGMAASRTYRRWGWATALAGCGVLAVTPAYMGHAAVAERWGGVAVASDVLHVVAGGAWAGGLGALAWAIAKSDSGGADAATLIDRFGPLAIAGASGLLATGALSATSQLRAPADLVGSAYGRTLLVKVVIVLGAAVLGRKHSRTAARDVRAGKQAAVARSIAGEILVMYVVFAVTAILTGSPRPGE